MKKNVIVLFISTVVSMLAVILFGEIYFRFFCYYGYLSTDIHKNCSIQYVPSLFARHVFPQKQLLVDLWTGAKAYINERGYRGHNFEIDKPDGTIRIMFYGGSVVFDPVAPQGKDWPHRVEDILKKSGFPNVEVVNAGIPGHASWDSFGRFF